MRIDPTADAVGYVAPPLRGFKTESKQSQKTGTRVNSISLTPA